jgi:hypothetical protein
VSSIIEGIWSVEIVGLFAWEHIGIAVLENGRVITGGNNHYAVGTYKFSGKQVTITMRVEYFGKPRIMFGSKEKTIKLKIAGKIHDGVIEAVARHKSTDKEIPCRMTRCADIPASG